MAVNPLRLEVRALGERIADVSNGLDAVKVKRRDGNPTLTIVAARQTKRCRTAQRHIVEQLDVAHFDREYVLFRHDLVAEGAMDAVEGAQAPAGAPPIA